MLLYFSVANFRSILHEATLSMSAGRFKSAINERGFESGFAQFPCVLRGAAIYGGNASGKSSFIRALDLFQDIVIDSFRDEEGGVLNRTQPYKLNKEASPKTRFEIAFIYGEVFYTYGFVCNADLIHEEWMHIKSREGRTREVYSRSILEDGSYDWYFSPFFKSKRQAQTWKESTRPNALFLSTAIHLNCEELRAPHEWLTKNLRILSPSLSAGTNTTSRFANENAEFRKSVVEFLKFADSSISDISFRERNINELEGFSYFRDEIRSHLLSMVKENHLDVIVHHIGHDGQVAEIDLDEESDGTRVMFRYAYSFVKAMENNWTVVIDELDRSLHPLLLRYLVDRFHRSAKAGCRAQLIFTTHDSALLSADILAPDQVWFMENRSREGSQIIPLMDYKPRKGEAIQRAYLHGRYGGVPNNQPRLFSDA